jgi:hypothetical protein
MGVLLGRTSEPSENCGRGSVLTPGLVGLSNPQYAAAIAVQSAVRLMDGKTDDARAPRGPHCPPAVASVAAYEAELRPVARATPG